MHRRDVLTLGGLSIVPFWAQNQPSVPRVVATMGHEDHGKTTLTAALTKVLEFRGQSKAVAHADIHRANPRREGGVPFSAFDVEFRARGRSYRATDCPDHSDYVKAVLTGSLHMDATVLVVSALDSVMRETRNHVVLSRAAGARRLVVFLNKIDRVPDREMLDLVERETRDLAAKFGFAPTMPVVRGSALLALQAPTAEHEHAACIWELVAALHGTAPRLPPKRASGRPKTRLEAIVYALTPAEGGRSPAFPDEYHAKLRFRRHEVDARISGIGRASGLGPEVEVTIETSGVGAQCDVGWEFTIHEHDRLVGIGLVTKAEVVPPALRPGR